VSLPETIPPGEYVPTADQRVVFHGVSWENYEAQLAVRGDKSAPRIAYLDGALEIMSPSKGHERIKSYIGRLIEAYAIERGIDLSPYGSWTLKKAPAKSGVEPDECYIIGRDQDRVKPDLAIEVVWTTGGVEKLEIYRRLGVAEVWIWEKGHIGVHRLKGARYSRVEKSALFPELDVRGLTLFLEHPTTTGAVRAFLATLRKRR
jgi:Uma2 family endonuclease